MKRAQTMEDPCSDEEKIDSEEENIVNAGTVRRWDAEDLRPQYKSKASDRAQRLRDREQRLGKGTESHGYASWTRLTKDVGELHLLGAKSGQVRLAASPLLTRGIVRKALGSCRTQWHWGWQSRQNKAENHLQGHWTRAGYHVFSRTLFAGRFSSDHLRRFPLGVLLLEAVGHCKGFLILRFSPCIR